MHYLSLSRIYSYDSAIAVTQGTHAVRGTHLCASLNLGSHIVVLQLTQNLMHNPQIMLPDHAIYLKW